MILSKGVSHTLPAGAKLVLPILTKRNNKNKKPIADQQVRLLFTPDDPRSPTASPERAAPIAIGPPAAAKSSSASAKPAIDANNSSATHQDPRTRTQQASASSTSV